MADSAFQIQYRQELIAQFEQGQSWLRTVCTTEAVIKGNQAMFLVAGSGGAPPTQAGTKATAPMCRVPRRGRPPRRAPGLNGTIRPRVDGPPQAPATLV